MGDLGLIPGLGRSLGEGNGIPVLLSGKFHGWRNLVGYSPWDHKESDTSPVRLAEGETRSCSDGQGHSQQIFNPIFCWWLELCSFPAIYLGPNYGGGNEDNGDLLQKIPACTATLSAPSPAAGHHPPTPPLGPGAHKVHLNPLSISGRDGFVSKREFTPPTILLGLLLCP